MVAIYIGLTTPPPHHLTYLFSTPFCSYSTDTALHYRFRTFRTYRAHSCTLRTTRLRLFTTTHYARLLQFSWFVPHAPRPHYRVLVYAFTFYARASYLPYTFTTHAVRLRTAHHTRTVAGLNGCPDAYRRVHTLPTHTRSCTPPTTRTHTYTRLPPHTHPLTTPHTRTYTHVCVAGRLPPHTRTHTHPHHPHPTTVGLRVLVTVYRCAPPTPAFVPLPSTHVPAFYRHFPVAGLFGSFYTPPPLPTRFGLPARTYTVYARLVGCYACRGLRAHVFAFGG